MHDKGLDDYKYSQCRKGTNATVTLPRDQATKLQKLRCFSDVMETAEAMANLCVTDDFSRNLTQLQKVLLQRNWKLGHVGFRRLQWIGRQGWSGKIGERFGVSSTQHPKCGA